MSRRPGPPAEIAELFPPYPYDRHRADRRPGRGRGRGLRAGRDQRRHPQAVAAAARAPPRARAGAGRTRAGARCPTLLGKGDGIGSNALGGRRRPLHDRQADPGQRPAPRRLDAGHLVPDGPALHDGSATTCPFDVSGFTFSGLPGRGDRPQPADRLGLHQPRPGRHRPLPREGRRARRYLYDGRRRPLRLRDEEIKVARADEPFRFTVRSTRHGPLLSDVVRAAEHGRAPTRRPATARPTRGNGYAVALAVDRAAPRAPPRTRSSRSTGPPTGSSSGPRPRTSRCPSQNLVYADRAGNIGYQAPGPDPDPQVRQHRRLPGPGLAASPTTGPAGTSRSPRCPAC